VKPQIRQNDTVGSVITTVGGCLLLRQNVKYAQEYLAFVLLNLFDLFLTGYIFRYEGMEANAAAQAIIERYGYLGFVVYKFALVTIVVLACEAIAKKNEQLAKIIIMFGCIVYTALVLYEIALIVHVIHGIRLG
jgi:hypothetical protein